MNAGMSIKKFNIAFFLRSMLLLQPVMLLFYQLNGLTIKEFFFFQGVFYIASIIFEIPVGYLADNISQKKLIITSFIIYLGSTILWIFFHGYGIILLGEILFALSKVLMDNTMSGYLCDFLNNINLKDCMTKYYGELNFCLSLGTSVAALLGTYLFKSFGVKFVLYCEVFILLAAIFLIITLPDFKYNTKKSLKKQISGYSIAIKRILRNPDIKYYILYSGLLSSFSILFAASFQPLMLNSLCPISFFGGIVFINHGIRALSGILVGKISFSIKNLIKPLFFLYLLAFCFIFIILHSRNLFLVGGLLGLICLIIGIQLLFTIKHVSRLHDFVTISSRGSIIAVNNIITRSLSAIFLISSRVFINKTNLDLFFLNMFIIFIVLGSFISIKSYKVVKNV